ncbi:MAG: ATP-binding protein [Chthoniobacterales bacterium]
MKSLTLRAKLTFWAAFTFGLVLSAFGVGVSLHIYYEILSSLHDDLHDESIAFFQTLDKHPGPINWDDPRIVRNDLRDVPMFHPFEVCDLEGKPLFRSLGMGRMSLATVSNAPGYHPWHDQGRKYVIGVFAGKDILLRIVGDVDNVDEIGFDLVSSFLFAGPVMLLLGGFGSWLLLRRAFRPVEQIVSAAERITTQNLHERLPASGTTDEIGRLTGVVNSMIERMEIGFQQATRFSADASHELRTPLTILRNDLEHHLNLSQRDPEIQAQLVEYLEQITRLSVIIDKLLLLSRADVGHLVIQSSGFDFCELLNGNIEDIEILGSSQFLTVETHLPEWLPVVGDPDLLRQMLLNLLENAVKYNQPHGLIRVSLTADNHTLELRIANSGPIIPIGQAAFLFQRFYRAGNRGSERGHGLGLSICREIARAHGGDISFSPDTTPLNEFVLRLPLQCPRGGAVSRS